MRAGRRAKRRPDLSHLWRAKTTVYEIVVDGERVYVGCSVKPERRLYEHKWKGSVPEHAEVRVVSWHDCRGDALQAEEDEIAKSCPPMNFCHRSDLQKQRDDARLQKKLDAWEAERLVKKAEWDRLTADYEEWLREQQGK